MINRTYTLRAISPVHCGIGQGLNDIDLPTARNKLSGHPIIPSSSLKGVLKNEFKSQSDNEDWQESCKALFGADGGGEFASAFSMGDANLLALAVRSFYGTYAYLASPYTLQMIKGLLNRSHYTQKIPKLPTIGIDENTVTYKAQVCKETVLAHTDNGYVLLEELDLFIDVKNSADEWADLLAPLFFDEEGQAIFKKRFAIVDDNALNFLCESNLPVDARITIDEATGTVKDGALWYEESIPMESLFMGNAAIDRSYYSRVKKTDQELSDILTEKKEITCQVGGKSTTGKGLVEIIFQDKGE